jgi:outer membrane protein assembly factor BamB
LEVPLTVRRYHTLEILLVLWFLTDCNQVRGADWPAWRGPRRDAICREKGLLQQWPPEGPPLAWRTTGLGQGYSGPAIVGRTLYTMGNKDGREWVIALDVDNGGRQRWATALGPITYDGQYPGTRATPTLDGRRLYVVGTAGTLACLDASSGREQWSRSLVTDFGGAVPRWGYSESVLIDGDLLLCTPGGSRATMAALDKNTGRVVWQSPIGDPASYASVVKAQLAGVDQYVQFTGKGVVGVDARTGRFLWRYDAPSYDRFGGINIATPICANDNVFAASDYNVGGGLAAIEKTPQGLAAREVYFTKDMKNHHGGLILLDGVLYGCNNPGILTCMDFNTGTVRWQSREPGKCSLLYADGMLYCRDEKGPISLVEADPDRFLLRGRFDQPDRSEDRAWPHLVIADGRLYVRDQDLLLCYDVRKP